MKKQKDTNEQVAKLYETMISTYEMASENKALRDIKRLTSVYEALFKQTISCARFIEGYAKQGIVGEYELQRCLEMLIKQARTDDQRQPI